MNILEARRRLLGRNVYKRTTEGNPAIAQGSLARMYPGITMQGWTEQVQYEGNQLLDASVFNGMEKSGVSVSVDNGVITASGMSETSIWIESTKFSEEDFKKLKSGNIYVKNYKSSDCNYECGIYINNTAVSEGNSPLNIPEGYLETNPNNAYFYISIQAGVELKGTIQPMIYQDGDGTYEPYTGGAPSPSPDYPQPITSAGKYSEETQKYQYEVKLTGANLFDISKVITNSGLLTNNGDGTLTATPGSGDSAVSGKVPRTLRDYCPELISGKTYRLSGNTTGTVKQIYLSGVNNVWGYGRSRTITDADLESEFFFYASGVNSEAVISDIMITEVEDADYEPYRTPQIVTLTSDRPLTKWDKLEKRNGQWGWVYKSKRFTSNDMIGFNDTWMPSMVWSIKNKEDYVVYNKDFYCEYFKVVRASNSAGSGFEINVNDYPEIQTAEAMADFVNSKEGSELPVTVCAETIQETFVPLSETEQESMNELYTFRPTTVLSNDCDCNMSLTYKTKKSLEVTT